MRKGRKFFAVCILAVTGVLAGCQHIPLMDPSSGLYVAFDFVYMDEDGVQVEGAKASSWLEIAEVMHVLVYDIESHRFIHEEYLPPEGGFVNVGPGYYDIIAYGEGSDVVRTSGLGVRGDAYAYCDNVGASVRMSKASTDGTEFNLSFPVINEPDCFVVATSENVFVPDSDGASQTIWLEMKVYPLVSEWTFVAENVVGVENIRSMNCYVTGQVPGRYLWDSRMPQSLCAIGFGVAFDEGRNVLDGSFRTFGKHPQALANVFLNVMVQSSGGGLYQWIFDVTSQFDNPDNTEHLLRVSSPIVVPAADGGGFAPEVSDWNAEITYVPLN